MRWLLLGAGLFQTGLLVAQVTQNMDPGILSLVGNGVTIVVLAWYVVYDVRTRTPNMLTAFGKEQSDLRVLFQKETAEMRMSQTTILNLVRETFLHEQTETRRTFTAESAAARAEHNTERREMRQMLFENIKAMGTAVCDVRDTAQILMNDKEIAKLDRTSGAG